MTNYEKVKIVYTFTPHSLLKVGAGYGKNSYVDNAFRTRRKIVNGQHFEQVYEIPATSVKGRLRANFEKQSHLFTEPQLVNHIFGMNEKRTAGWAHFSSLAPSQTMQIENATNTAIDRFRKAAKHMSLRVTEYAQVAEEDVLTGTIEGYRLKNTSKEDIYALLLTLITTKYFGGNKSVGFGQGTISVIACQIGDMALSVEQIEQQIYDQLMREGGKNVD